jgi:hypothetical protein
MTQYHKDISRDLAIIRRASIAAAVCYYLAMACSVAATILIVVAAAGR